MPGPLAVGEPVDVELGLIDMLAVGVIVRVDVGEPDGEPEVEGVTVVDAELDPEIVCVAETDAVCVELEVIERLEETDPEREGDGVNVSDWEAVALSDVVCELELVGLGDSVSVALCVRDTLGVDVGETVSVAL